MSATASSSIESSVKDHISLILAGKALEGLEKYYAEDAVMQENDQPPRVGKAANRAFEQDFFSKVTTVRTFANDGYVVSGNRAFVVWRVDIDRGVGHHQHDPGCDPGMEGRPNRAREVRVLVIPARREPAIFPARYMCRIKVAANHTATTTAIPSAAPAMILNVTP